MFVIIFYFYASCCSQVTTNNRQQLLLKGLLLSEQLTELAEFIELHSHGRGMNCVQGLRNDSADDDIVNDNNTQQQQHHNHLDSVVIVRLIDSFRLLETYFAFFYSHIGCGGLSRLPMFLSPRESACFVLKSQLDCLRCSKTNLSLKVFHC